MNITLTPDQVTIIKRQMSSGRYRSANGVVSDALHLLQAHNRTDAEKLKDLRREIALGLEQAERGELVEFDDAVLDEIKRSGRQRQRQARKSKSA